MDKKTFHDNRYFILIQIIFWVVFLFFIFLGILGIFYEDDMPLVAFFCAGVTFVVYWSIQKISYKILSRKKR